MNARNIQLLTITMLVLIATPCMRAKPCFVEIVEVEIPNTDELGINTEEKQLVTPKPCIPIPENTSITSIPANTPSTPIPANTPSTSIPANTPSTPIPANTPKPIIQIPIGEYKTFTNVGPFEEGYFGFN